MNNENFSEIIKFASQLRIQWIIMLAFGFCALIYSVKLLRKASQFLSNKMPKQRLLFFQIETTTVFFVYILGGTMLIYSMLSPAKELMIAIGGGMMVAVGFSLKDLVASLFAAMTLLFDRPFQVGDRVTFGTSYGEIKSIGLRAVRLQTLDDNTVTIPNVRFITDAVASGNSGALDMMVVVPFFVALDSDISRAKDIIYETVITSCYTYLKKPVLIVASEESFPTGFFVRLNAKAYVLDVQYEEQMKTDIVLRANEAFLREGIKRPVLSCVHTGGNKNEQPICSRD